MALHSPTWGQEGFAEALEDGPGRPGRLPSLLARRVSLPERASAPRHEPAARADPYRHPLGFPRRLNEELVIAHAQDDYDHLRDSADAVRRPACERLIWMHGTQRACGQDLGVKSWTDSAGTRHAACRHHRAELLHRYPDAVPA